MNTTRLLLTTCAALLVAGVAAGASQGSPQALAHAADKAKDLASDHSVFFPRGERAHGHADDTVSAHADPRCDEFDNHGDYVSGVAQENETGTDNASHGATVREAAQSDVGKCTGDHAAAHDGANEAAHDHRTRQDNATHGNETADTDDDADDAGENGRSDEARTEHPPRRP